MLVVISIAIYGVLAILRARREQRVSVHETPYEPMPALAAAH
jgi:carbon starvation protein